MTNEFVPCVPFKLVPHLGLYSFSFFSLSPCPKYGSRYSQVLNERKTANAADCTVVNIARFTYIHKRTGNASLSHSYFFLFYEKV